MESNNNNNNLHSSQHHHLEDHLDGSSLIPSSLGFPSLSVAHNSHAWRPTPTFFLNNNMHATCDETSPSSFNNSMIQDLRFSLPNNLNIISNQIKEESSTSSDQSNITSSSFQTFSEMLSPSTTPSEMLLLNSLSPTYKNHHMLQASPFQPFMHFRDNNNNTSNDLPSLGEISTGKTTFSQIFPSVNISKLSPSSTMDSSNFRGGLERVATDSYLGSGSHDQAPNSNLLELFKGSSQYRVDHDLQDSSDLKLCNTSKNLSSFGNNGVLEPKRPSCIVEPESTHQTTSKRQRFETRTSLPPLKVRKEKLGDRIAALQQLVAPFGKTDTASVLMEAIGYIKFLQNQVETLSVPYMKLGSRNNNLQRSQISNEHCESEATKQDLRSRGLCLVPLTCLSYITIDFDIHGGIWPPHHFNPGF